MIAATPLDPSHLHATHNNNNNNHMDTDKYNLRHYH